MNKKLLTVAIGAALSAVPMLAAQADVKVGGMAQAEYYSAKATCNIGTTAASGTGIFSGSGACAGTNAASAKGTGLIDNARGRFWISADEDLGANMKGLAYYEVSVDTANSGQSAANGNGAYPYDTTVRGFDARTREKYVGLSGGFGAFKFGNQHGVYKRMGGVRWDPFNATVLEARSNGGQSGADVSGTFAHNGFIPGAIKWESGKLLGDMVLLEVLYAPHKNSNGAGDLTGTGDDYQAGVSVKPIKDLEIVAAFSDNKKTPDVATNSDQKATKLGARYTFLSAHTVFVQYEKTDMNNSAVASVPTSVGITTVAVAKGKYTLLGYSLKLGNASIVAQIGKHQRDLVGLSSLEAKYAATGVMYNFSKTTRAWLGYRSTKVTEATISNDQKVFALGLRKDF